ncbi:MAG: hypothetical protein JF603_05365 [Acidobacteria bacterium]|nr:hypothetical protein [Acidobacteriota bacterium]
MLWSLVSLWAPVFLALTYRYRIAVVTDRAIVVLESYRWRSTVPARVQAHLPRRMRLGLLAGPYTEMELGGETLERRSDPGTPLTDQGWSAALDRS